MIAVSSFEVKLWTRKGSLEERQALYDNHQPEHTENRVVDIMGAKPVLERLDGEDMTQYFKLPKNLHRVLFCVHCGTSGVTGPQGAHVCDGVKESMELIGRTSERERWETVEGDDLDLGRKRDRSMKRMKRSRDPKLGVLSFKVVFGRELFHHIDSLDMSGVNAETLAERNLVWLDPTPYLVGALQAGLYTGLLQEPIAVPNILFHKLSSPQFIVTVGVYRYIQTLETPMTEYDRTSTSPAEINQKLFESVIRMLGKVGSTTPIRYATCPKKGCVYQSLKTVTSQHPCVNGTRPGSELSTLQVAYAFRENLLSQCSSACGWRTPINTINGTPKSPRPSFCGQFRGRLRRFLVAKDGSRGKLMAGEALLEGANEYWVAGLIERTKDPSNQVDSLITKSPP